MGSNYDTMEQEFEDIDSSGRWQNLYNVSLDSGPPCFYDDGMLTLLANGSFDSLVTALMAFS